MTQYISALLYRYPCVIVPGFGAFITEIQSSFYDVEKQMFFPPQKRISFNRNIVNNDGLLANHIATQEQLSYEEAVTRIQAMVADWNNTLTSFDSLNLESIGIFSYNEEKSLQFDPIQNQNYLATSFGLSAVGVQALSRAEKETTPVIAIESVTGKTRRTATFFKYASVLVLTLGIGSVLVQNGYTAYVNDQTLSIENNVQSQVQNKLQQATFIIEPSMEAIALPVKDESVVVATPYHLVAAAFRSEENAAVEVEILKKKGFNNASFLGRTKYGMYPVVYGSFSTQEEAKETLKEIHRTTNKEAWIFIK
ncbi:HU-CCDC81 and SPOR domain-containing protein [Myroides sp. 1354]|uniref:HU domain-containing protein n=1 Tax=unclassified Myroides TaxID=2642485 RepID=UPI002575AFDA|nr:MULTISPECIES: SPOR domain-containing protein [unclassified Myroides]MDM1043594.1 HU-CCDC81 and SPOR domain-containing protein [Myroides sp. R163-1]MDM1054356.1 HU-CCDC81 and SPOR domain-containing protein [Myroides sp. 1354]MDM1067652.1 HU-CCDC81 and SPOR domain-containing protein [Myroides sp. 1372]